MSFLNRFRIIATSCLIVGALFCSPGQMAVAASDDSFFPVMPSGAHLQRLSGVLVNYGMGNHSGDVSVRTRAGREVHFFVGDRLLINGSRVACAMPPKPGEPAPSELMCEHWPKEIVLGRTSVTVTYWKQMGREGSKVLVTNNVRSGP